MQIHSTAWRSADPLCFRSPMYIGTVYVGAGGGKGGSELCRIKNTGAKMTGTILQVLQEQPCHYEKTASFHLKWRGTSAAIVSF